LVQILDSKFKMSRKNPANHRCSVVYYEKVTFYLNSWLMIKLCGNSCWRSCDKRKRASAASQPHDTRDARGGVARCFSIRIAHMADVAYCHYILTPQPSALPLPPSSADGAALPTPPPSARAFAERSSPTDVGLPSACVLLPLAFPS
jgi:hypothetical protein